MISSGMFKGAQECSDMIRKEVLCPQRQTTNLLRGWTSGAGCSRSFKGTNDEQTCDREDRGNNAGWISICGTGPVNILIYESPHTSISVPSSAMQDQAAFAFPGRCLPYSFGHWRIASHHVRLSLLRLVACVF